MLKLFAPKKYIKDFRHVDIETLKNNRLYTKKLTDNDKKRLSNLLNSEFHEVVSYMLENDCKLEQEAMD